MDNLMTPGQAALSVTFTWDYREQPPMEAIGNRVAQLTGGAVTMEMPETGSDEHELVIAARQPQPAPGLAGRPATSLEDAMLSDIDDLHDLLRDILTGSVQGTSADARWRAGCLNVHDSDGQPFGRGPRPAPVTAAPAVVRPLFGSVLVLALHPDQDDETARRGEEAVRAATEGEGVTVVTVRGVEALRTWEPPAPALGTAWRLLNEARATLSRVRAVAEVAAKGEAARLPESPKGTLARQILEEMDPQ